MQSNRNGLLLTATIRPHNKNWVMRNDENIRHADYVQALKKWLTKQSSITHIVFVENSGSDLSELKSMVRAVNQTNKQVEFLSYTYQPQDETHIGLGELSAIEYGLMHSELLKSCEKFIKMTGRLFVKNIDAITNHLHDNFHMVSSFSENLTYVDSSMVIFDKEFYLSRIAKEAAGHLKQNVTRVDFEQAYAKAFHHAIADDYRWFPFPIWPIIEGMSGTKNKKYSAYSLFRSIRVTPVSALYHLMHRNVFTNKLQRKHLLERWGIHPKDLPSNRSH